MATHAGCRFGVLGPLLFERDGAPMPVPSGRQRTLLALLLMAGGEPLSRDRLIDELWGEDRPATAVSALHVHLSKLRELLGEVLERDAAGYRLRRGAFWLDVAEFEALVVAAREDGGRARALLGEALSLVRGAPLCDVAWEGSLAGWQRSLEEQRLQATLMRIELDLETGGGELIAELERLVERHPFEERAWLALMTALHRGGRVADALAAFQRVRRLFASELGLEPGSSLVRLHDRILAGDAAPPTARAVEAETARRSSLPRPLTRLVGRDDDLTALRGRLADPDLRLLTLTGPGGVGKTRLLIELGRMLESEYQHGALLVRLDGLTEPGSAMPEIAAALAQRDGVEGLGRGGLEGYLGDREVLLVLDNFEHLLPAAAAVAKLLEQAPRTRVLVSSRIPLQLRGEHVYEVEPLQLPRDDSDATIAASASVQLFLQSALAANRRLRIDRELSREVAEICRALDGLPLAIELTASRFGAFGAGPGLRDLPDRQRTIESTLRWSYDLLSPAAQEVLQACGVFVGGFDVEALDGVAGRRAGDELNELVEASLIRGPNDAGRFWLLELIRTFALAELVASGREHEIRDRHMQHFAARLAPANAALDAGQAPATVAGPWLAEHANLRAALDHAIASGDAGKATQLALGMRPIWFASMLTAETHGFIERILELPDVSIELEIKLLQAAVFVAFAQTTLPWLRQLAARTGEIGDRDSQAMAVCNYYALASNTRDLAEMASVRPTLDGLAEAELGDRARGWVQYFLAIDEYVNARFTQSAEHAEQSRQCAASCGHAFLLGCASAMRLLGASARDRSLSRADLLDAIEYIRAPGVPPLSVFGLWLVARYASEHDPHFATELLVNARRVVATLEVEIWPESSLRDETLAVLGLTDLDEQAQNVSVTDPERVMDTAIAWLGARDPLEVAPRREVAVLSRAG